MYQCKEEHECVNNQVGKTSIPDKFMCIMLVEVKGKIIRNQVTSYWVGVGSRGQEGIEGNILDPEQVGDAHILVGHCSNPSLL